jgi:adenylate cyclase
MTDLSLAAIRDCLDGEVPGVIATCSVDGEPNGSFVSQVHYVDPQHVALSFQFFNKTHRNIQANPVATAMVTHPITAATYRLALRYLRTEVEGPVFENMKAKLAGIASHTGMGGVFRLRGADIYHVEHIHAVPAKVLPTPPRRSLLAAVRSYAQATGRWNDLSSLLEGTLDQLAVLLDARHSMIHWLDESGERLYLVASRGYPQSGIGSEVQLGQGLIGAAAQARTSIRITHATAEYTYGRATRDSVRRSHLSDRLEAEIPLPGLPKPGSQLAVPIMARSRLLGVLCLESPEELRFGYDEEDALVAIAEHLGLAAQLVAQNFERPAEEPQRATPSPELMPGRMLTIRHYIVDDTIFLDDTYLIKGVAGAILWKLLREYESSKRTDFTNRELRLDASLPLPELSSNLEARLILLQRRLGERSPALAIEKTGRGRFRLRVDRPIKLLDVG